MVLCKRINFIWFYFVFVFLFTFACCSYEESKSSNNTMKSLIVQEIMKKVSYLTSALSKAPHENREMILNKIEQKLRKSAKSVGPDGEKYINFIMEEFKAKTIGSVTVKEEKKYPDDPKVVRKSITHKTKAEVKKPRRTIDSETKKEMIKDIANKTQILAKGFMKNAKTIESKKQIFEPIKKINKISTKQKHKQLHNKHDEFKAYSGLIAQSVDVSMRNNMLANEKDGRRNDSQIYPNPVSEEVIVKDHHELEDLMNAEEDILKRMVETDVEEIKKYKRLISQSMNGTSIDPSCNEIVEDTCLSLQSFNQISCGGGKTTSVENLCNGVNDCLNNVDELNCTTQAREMVRKATAVMSDIEAVINLKCFTLSEDRHLASQNQILRDALQTQMIFLQATENKDQDIDEIFIKKTMADINMILRTLWYALDGALCAHYVDPNRLQNRQFRDIETPPAWSPKTCHCDGPICKDLTCEAPCKRICQQRYSLNHWGCQAFNGNTGVSLDVLCDGKLDCFDESDESSCAKDGPTSKMEAAKSYSNLLDLLSTKSKSYEFLTSRNKLLAMHVLVSQLQKQTIKTNTVSRTIKSLRDETFMQLVSIYDDLLENVSLHELNDDFPILLTINEKLVTALKYSHTGNEKIISPEGCYCRGGLCALRRCNKNCIQTCLAKPLLTRFACDDIKNLTIPIESICNEKNDCPKEEDEKDCSKDICRGHHLVVLRHNLQNVGAKYKGSVMGEEIESWKTKVSATLFDTETTQRPNHKVIVEIVSRVLNDLVMAYVAMEDYKKSSSEYALKEFVGISNIVKQALKSCA